MVRTRTRIAGILIALGFAALTFALWALWNRPTPEPPWPARIQAPLNVKGIFEIGPVDGQTGRRLDAMGTAWNVILPMCDGDVSNLQGMKPFDRMLVQNTETRATSKGMFAVWGANHNFYNTEWQTSDSRGCVGTGHTPLFAPSGQIASLSQQATGLYSMMGFFRAHVGDGAASAFNNTFDPKFGLPEGLESITRIQRAYIDSVDAEHAIALENFTQTGTAIAQNVAVTYGAVPEHDALLRAAMVTWEAGGEGTYFEVPFASGGVNASGFETFDFRVALTDNASAATVAAGPVDFSVQLVTGDGTLSKAVKLGSYVELVGNGGHRVLETARIPAGDFGVDLASVRGARFVFDGTAAGKVYLTNLRFSKAVQGKSLPAQLGNPLALNDQGSPNARPPIRVTTGNQVNELRRAAGEGVEIDLSSTTEFPISDELPRLRIGGQDVTLSRYADDGDSRHVIFTLTDGEFAAAQDGAALQVRYGDETATIEWDFGNLSKGAVR